MDRDRHRRDEAENPLQGGPDQSSGLSGKPNPASIPAEGGVSGPASKAGMVGGRQHYPCLDGLRAISILLVLAAHLLPLGPKNLGLNHTAGAMGMSLFFSLSGFLITQQLLAGNSIRQFLIRRAARILPLSYLYLLILLISGLLTVLAAAASSLFLINYLDQFITPLTAHLWSLCVEVHFYVVIALVTAVFGQRGLWLVVPACLIVTATRISNGAYIDIRTHHRVDEILVGAIVALIALTIRKPHSSRPMLLLILGVSAWFTASHPQTGGAQYFRPYGTALVLYAALAFQNGFVHRLLGSAPLRYIAQISYALYVIHPITAYGFMNSGSVWERYLIKRPISFLLTFALASLSTFKWEAYWIARAKQITRG